MLCLVGGTFGPLAEFRGYGPLARSRWSIFSWSGFGFGHYVMSAFGLFLAVSSGPMVWQILRRWWWFDVASLRYIFLASLVTDCWIDIICVEAWMVVFRTYHGEPVIVRRAMFCTDSSFFQLVRESWAPHAGPAYVSIVLTYIWNMYSLARSGIGLWWLIIGYKAALVRFALIAVSMAWRRNVNLLSRWTPRYLTVVLHWIAELLISSVEVFLSPLLPSLMAMDFSGLRVSLQFFNQGRVAFIWVWSLSTACCMPMLVDMNMVSSANRFVIDPGVEGMSLMKAMNSNGDRHDPWGTPAPGCLGVEKADPTFTEYDRFDKNDWTRLTSCGGVLSWSNLCSSPSCHILSNAFSKSRKTAAVFSPRFVALVRWSTTCVSWFVVECCGRKANCSGLIDGDSVFLSLIRTKISSTFAMELIREIGRWLLGFFRSFPGFGIIMTVAIFQGAGKYWYLKQVFRIFVRTSKVLSEKCRRAVLGMPSGPGALFRGKRLIMSCTSPGDTGWIRDLAAECRVWIEPVTSSFVDGVPSGQVNWAQKRPAPSTTSQPLSPKSPHSSNQLLTMKPPNAPEGKTQPSKNPNGNVHKKPKVRTSTSSNDSFYSNIDVGLNPTKDLFNSNPQNMSLSLNQFKDFFENSQGCTDLESLCTEHNSTPENIIQIISNIYPVVTIKSIKNRLTRLSKALEKVRNINSSQTFYPDSNDDETY